MIQQDDDKATLYDAEADIAHSPIPCSYCDYLIALPNSPVCSECGKVTPEELQSVPVHQRLLWEMRIDSNLVVRFLRTVCAASVRYPRYLKVLSHRCSSTIYQVKWLATCFFLTVAAIPLVSKISVLIQHPVLRYGVSGATKWVTWWFRTIPRLIFHTSGMLAAEVIVNLFELTILTTLLPIAGRIHGRKVSFSWALCVIGPPTIVVFFLRTLVLDYSAMLMSSRGWNLIEYAAAIIVWGPTIVIGFCVATASFIAVRVPWYSAALAGVVAGGLTYRLTASGTLLSLWLWGNQ